jgi:hypothetical protein
MSIKLFTLLIAMLLGAAAVDVVRAQNAVLAKDLAKVFDAYNAAVKAKDIDKALGFRASAFKRHKGLDKKLDGKERQMYLFDVRDEIPESYQVEYAAFEVELKNGFKTNKQKATLGVVAQLSDDDKKIKSRILNIAFAKEGGTWKMREYLFWMVDVDGLKRPKNTTFEPKGAYNEGWEMGGRIIKTAFNADHTLVMLREGDRESAVFLPAKGALSEMKLKPEDLQPGNTVQFKGLLHKQDPLKLWATSGEELGD